MRGSCAAFVLLLLSVPSASAFSGGAATCSAATVTQFHGLDSGGSGGFTFTATIEGQPVTEAHPGQTVRLTLSRAMTYKGFLVRATEGTANGPLVPGLAVTDPSTQKLEAVCSPLGSAATQFFNGSPLDRTSDALDWTVPIGTTPGTQVVLSAIPVVSMLEWYGASTPIQQTITVTAIPPAVPAFGPMGHWVLVGLLGATAFRFRGGGEARD